jgi:hypothetical protein
MLSCSKLEQDNMASEIRNDQCVAPERKPPKDLRSTTQTSPQGGPPVNDGPELLRSNHC